MLISKTIFKLNMFFNIDVTTTSEKDWVMYSGLTALAAFKEIARIVGVAGLRCGAVAHPAEADGPQGCNRA